MACATARTTPRRRSPPAPVAPPAYARSSPASAVARTSGLEQHLEGAVLLLLEHVVGLRRLLEGHVVRREALQAERVGVVGYDRHEVVDPATDVRPPHAERQ